jgi:pimeloyl-ACP methyl ester carboxylesterase
MRRHFKAWVSPNQKRNFNRHYSFIVIALCFVFLLQGCAAKRTPNLERIFADVRVRQGKAPLIVLPGALGSELINAKTGKIVWPAVFRTTDDELGLPISPDIANNRDNLVAGKIIDKIRLSKFVPEVYVYNGLLESLQKYGGYKEGDWTNPPADGYRDTFYVYPYDWRRDNVETAQKFIAQLEELKRKLNRPDLRFNVIAHSMGGLVARYAAMYGKADLSQDGAPPKPTWEGAKHIGKIFMFGTPNEGSAEAFATLINGYSITEGLRRPIRLLNKLSREDMLTSPAIFQLLPHKEAARFLDENLQPVKLDLYDAETWRYYGWTAAFDPKFREKFAAKRKGQLSAHSKNNDPLKELDDYMTAVLKRASAFHEALNVEIEERPPVLLFVFGGDCEETLNAPVIMRDKKKEKWITLIRPKSFTSSSGKKFSKEEVTRAMFTPGDGRVTRRSLLAETLAEKQRASNLFQTALPLTYAVFGCDVHGYLQNNPILQDNVLTALVSEAIK